MEKLLRTYEVAKICQVAQGTVIRWIKEGRLPASSTAGGHNRIRLEDLVLFLRNLNLPIPPEYTQDKTTRILIVDDEPEVRKMIRWMLEQDFKNISIDEAKEGFVAGWSTHSFRPDLVILDCMMPGLDGIQVCEFIRQFPELKHTKIIAMSALNDPEIGKKFLDLGADAFLTKPLDLDVLKNQIRALLNGHGKERINP
jgi:excisionase family DNA binding protein